MRLIDANAYAAELWKLRENYQMLDDTHTADKIMHGLYRAEQALKEQPTVDAVQVVRCKDCVYKKCVNDSNGEGLEYCGLMFCIITDNFHCGHGERKEKENESND